MKKILLFVVIGLIVLIVVASTLVAVFVGPIIKTGVETIGPKVTQVSIKLDAVDVSLINGSAAIKGLVVGNPEGFKTPEAIRLKRAEVRLDPLSVTKPKIVIRKIHVLSPEITYDGGLKVNNLTKIMDNVNSVAKKPEAKPQEKPKTETQPPAPKLQIDDFLITGAKVHVHLTAPINQDTTITIPDIHLTNLGKGEDGVTPAEVVRLVLAQVNTAVLKSVTNIVTNSTKMLEGVGKGVIKEGTGTLKNVGKELGNLFGK